MGVDMVGVQSGWEVLAAFWQDGIRDGLWRSIDLHMLQGDIDWAYVDPGLLMVINSMPDEFDWRVYAQVES